MNTVQNGHNFDLIVTIATFIVDVVLESKKYISNRDFIK